MVRYFNRSFTHKKEKEMPYSQKDVKIFRMQTLIKRALDRHIAVSEIEEWKTLAQEIVPRLHEIIEGRRVLVAKAVEVLQQLDAHAAQIFSITTSLSDELVYNFDNRAGSGQRVKLLGGVGQGKTYTPGVYLLTDPFFHYEDVGIRQITPTSFEKGGWSDERIEEFLTRTATFLRIKSTDVKAVDQSYINAEDTWIIEFRDPDDPPMFDRDLVEFGQEYGVLIELLGGKIDFGYPMRVSGFASAVKRFRDIIIEPRNCFMGQFTSRSSTQSVRRQNLET